MNNYRTNKFAFIIVLLSAIFVFRQSYAGMPDAKERLTTMQSPFGVLEFLHWNHSWNSYKYSCDKDWMNVITLMKQAGVAWVRVDFLWGDIEPAKGDFQFGKYDCIVDLLYKNNINILGILHYSTDWASSCGKWNCPPVDKGLFINYCSRVAKRYRGKVKFWEIWNEPDSSVYWSNQDGMVSYCRLLKDTYKALKKIDPECKVLNGGLANGLASVNKLYDNGAKDYFDILNIHIFESPLNRGAIKRVTAYPKLAYKVMQRHGDGNKKIWITETGCPGVKSGIYTENWWMGKNPNERQQAEWLKSVYTELLKDKNVDKIFWAFFRDCDKHWSNGVDYFGVIRWDFSKKPAFNAYKRLSESYKGR